MFALTHLLDWKLVPVVCLASTYAAVAGHLLLEPELNVGHRAGAEGYDGARLRARARAARCALPPRPQAAAVQAGQAAARLQPAAAHPAPRRPAPGARPAAGAARRRAVREHG
jgi:hypothetical protein